MALIEPRTVKLKDGTPCTIRSMREPDAANLRQHLINVARDGVYIVTMEDEVSSAEEFKRKIAKYNAGVNDINILAELEDGTLIGDLLAHGMDRRRVNHKIRFGLSVDGRYRDQGAGRAMISAMLDWACAHPTIEKVELGVFASNRRARHLYESLGFKEEGLKVREIRVGPGQYEDDVAMALFFPPK